MSNSISSNEGRDVSIKLAAQVGCLAILVVSVLYALLVLAAFVFSIPLYEPWWDWDAASNLGDAVNVANTFFSGLAFAGVIVAILLQTRELGMQRQEIDDSQKIWQETATAQAESQKALRDQADSVFLAAYLQAFIATLATTDSADAEVRRLKLVDLVQSLESRATTVLGHSIPLTSKWSIVATRLREIEVWFKACWQSPLPTDRESVQGHRMTLSELVHRLERLAPEFQDNRAEAFQSLLRKAAELQHREVTFPFQTTIMKTTGTSSPSIAAWNRDCIMLSDEIDSLASECEILAKPAAQRASQDKPG